MAGSVFPFMKGVPFFDSQPFVMVAVFYDCSGLIAYVSVYNQQGIGLMVDIKNSVRQVEHLALCLEGETETMPKSSFTKVCFDLCPVILRRQRRLNKKNLM